MTNFTAGSNLFASDTEGTTEVPLMKPMWGASGSAARVTLTTALPVQPGTSTTWTVTPGSGSVFTMSPNSGAVFTVTPNSGATFAVTQATLTKGTQGSTGVTTQDLKDAGRNLSTLGMVIPVVTTASEALVSLTGYKSGAAVAATTTPAVITAGKTYRAQSITITYVAVATAGYVSVRLRANTSGAVVLASPLVGTYTLGAGAATAGISNTVTIPLPDGMEFAAGTGLGISIQGYNATGTAAAVGYAQVQLNGYEY